MVPAKLHGKRLRIDVWIDVEMKYSIKFHFSLITFELQILPNLQGSCRNTSRWCLQIYMENGWELTSEFTSKWITFKNIQSNFTLISLITFEVLNQTLPNLKGSCRRNNTRSTQSFVPAKLHGKRLRIDVWIDVEMNDFYKYSIKFHTDLINNFWSTKSNFAKFTGKLS